MVIDKSPSNKLLPNTQTETIQKKGKRKKPRISHKDRKIAALGIDLGRIHFVDAILFTGNIYHARHLISFNNNTIMYQLLRFEKQILGLREEIMRTQNLSVIR